MNAGGTDAGGGGEVPVGGTGQQSVVSQASGQSSTNNAFGGAMGGTVGDGGNFLADSSQPYNAHQNSPQRMNNNNMINVQGAATAAAAGGVGGGFGQGGNGVVGGNPQYGGATGGLLSPPPQGSVTRFASPSPQPQSQPPQTPHPQQQQGVYGGGVSSPYNYSQAPPAPMPSGGTPASAGAGMSFAQRSAMLQQHQQQQQQMMVGGNNVYGGGGSAMQQQQPPQPQIQPPISQINVPSTSNAQQQYPGGGGGSGMSYAQRSQAIMPSPQNQQQPQQQQYNPVFSAVAGGSNAVYPPSPQLQQQQQPQMQQNSVMSAGASQMQQSQPQIQHAQQQPPSPAGSFAQRSAMMNQQQVQQPGMMQQQQQMQQPSPQQQMQYGQQQVGGIPPQSVVTAPSMGQSRMQQQPPQQPRPAANNPMIDSPEVLAQQQRLLMDATRKVQEHAYYMKQAMERNDLPAVLERAASLVGELGEHAHSHHHHHVHPPAPGATGSTTALSPKNYYELHLRALEELPTLEDYLLNLSQQSHNSNVSSSVPVPGTGSSPSHVSTMQGTAANPLENTNQSVMSQPQMQQPLIQPGGMTNQQFLQHNVGMPVNIPPRPKISYTMKELYDCVQYCPNVLSRLYLQICAASALIRSGEVGARWVMRDMIEAVKCVQNPVRGLFLRHYLLQAFRDKLPDEPIPVDQIGGPLTRGGANPSGERSNPVENVATPAPVESNSDDTVTEKGTVKDSYKFILANFIEMNKLWVRIQHLPGDGKSKEIRRRREKDRNELRILVGTNLVRLSALDSITSSIYGQVILPTVLDHIVICGDPLAQAYLIDCIVQVFPDEYHIETMPILLGVCPKLRDKVNIRTILQSLMDRLANYLADEELLDEKDSNQVKRSVAQDSFRMFDECVQNVYNARGPKLNAKEVIRLQMALLSFSMKCYSGNLEQVTHCLKNCVAALQQARDNVALMQENGPNMPPQQHGGMSKALDEVATKELEKLLSVPLEDLGLGVLNLDYYSDLIAFLPWANRRQVALSMLESVSTVGKSPRSVKEIDELFSVIAPVLRDETDAPPTNQNEMQDNMDRTADLMAGLGVSPQPQRYLSQQPPVDGSGDPVQDERDGTLVSKLIDMLNNSDTDILFEMLSVACNHLNSGRRQRVNTAYMALVFASLKLAKRIYSEEQPSPAEDDKTEKSSDSKPTETNDGKEEEATGGGDEETKTEEKEGESEEADQQTTEADAVDQAPESDSPEEATSVPEETESKSPKKINCRKVFIFVQETISSLGKINPERGVKLYLQSALTADKLGCSGGDEEEKLAFGSIASELVSQSFALYEESASADSRLQSPCVVSMIGTLLACRSLSKDDYENAIMKCSKYSAKLLKKPEQCEMVSMCSHLFYVVDASDDATVIYSNPQRCLECLQRALKLADACTTANPANVQLFVELFELYLYFFEKKNPKVTANYITGIAALIKEHTNTLGQFGGDTPVGAARAHFVEIVRYIKRTQSKDGEKGDQFKGIDVSAIQT
mmetsp:Transcript_8088/g.20281  ORF Transcript_8088/g.20281 Transcript_8088/m.20281 type:complete len:1509 (-) Transcript_8088:100-4626(-)